MGKAWGFIYVNKIKPLWVSKLIYTDNWIIPIWIMVMHFLAFLLCQLIYWLYYQSAVLAKYLFSSQFLANANKKQLNSMVFGIFLYALSQTTILFAQSKIAKLWNQLNFLWRFLLQWSKKQNCPCKYWRNFLNSKWPDKITNFNISYKILVGVNGAAFWHWATLQNVLLQ